MEGEDFNAGDHRIDCEVDISKLEPVPLAVTCAALARARQSRETQFHVLSFADFYHLAGLGDEVDNSNFRTAVAEAETVRVCFVDEEAQTRHSYPVFNFVAITSTSFGFVINAKALDAVLFPFSVKAVRAGKVGGTPLSSLRTPHS